MSNHFAKCDHKGELSVLSPTLGHGHLMFRYAFPPIVAKFTVDLNKVHKSHSPLVVKYGFITTMAHNMCKKVHVRHVLRLKKKIS